MMTRRRMAALTVLFGLLPVALAACGESGSNPVLFPEVRFQVQPVGGQAMFTVPWLASGGVAYTSQGASGLTTTGVFNFAIEGAAPPYSGMFVQMGTTPIRVALIVGGASSCNAGPTVESGSCIVVSNDSTCTVHPAADCDALPPSPNASPEVRFDVCSPLIGEPDPTCAATSNPPGRFGVGFNGTVGDFFRSIEVGQPATADPPTTAPTMYFLQSPRDQVSGIFRSNDGTLLNGLLLINGVFKQFASGMAGNDVVLTSDI
jgi:hypothetical protein